MLGQPQHFFVLAQGTVSRPRIAGIVRTKSGSDSDSSCGTSSSPSPAYPWALHWAVGINSSSLETEKSKCHTSLYRVPRTP